MALPFPHHGKEVVVCYREPVEVAVARGAPSTRSAAGRVRVRTPCNPLLPPGPGAGDHRRPGPFFVVPGSADSRWDQRGFADLRSMRTACTQPMSAPSVFLVPRALVTAVAQRHYSSCRTELNSESPSGGEVFFTGTCGDGFRVGDVGIGLRTARTRGSCKGAPSSFRGRTTRPARHGSRVFQGHVAPSRLALGRLMSRPPGRSITDCAASTRRTQHGSWPAYSRPLRATQSLTAAELPANGHRGRDVLRARSR